MNRVLLALTLLFLFAMTLRAESPVIVFTDQGRRMQGHVDPQTDTEWLWLRMSTPRVLLRSRVAWSRVTGVSQDGADVSRQQVLQLAATQKEQAAQNEQLVKAPEAAVEPVPPLMERRLLPEPVDPRPLVPEPDVVWFPDRMRRAAPLLPPVESIDATVTVANWDADPQADGLEVRVRARSGWGVPAAANGTVSVRFFVEPIQFGSRVTVLQRRRQAEEIGRWTVTVKPSEFSHGEVVVRLPFQRIDPLATRVYAPIGYALVSLGVSSQGVFRANTPVIVRDPWDDAFAPAAFHPRLFPRDGRWPD